MKTHHTRAPWKTATNLGCKDIGGGKPNSGKQAQYTVIATTVGLSDDRQDLANARLMAAAPWLLETVEMLVNYCGCAGEPACDGKKNFCVPCSVMRNLHQMKLA